MTRLGVPLLLLVLVGLASTGCGGGDEDRLTASTALLDFGRLLHGDVVERTLTLHNGSGRDVTITNWSFNCACFKLRPFGRLLHPGEDRVLTVKFLSGAVGVGSLHGKVLDLLSDDPAAPRIQVSLTGEIVHSLTLLPRALDLGTLGEPASLEPRTIQVRPGSGMTLELVRWRVQPAEQLHVEEKAVDGGYDFVVQWRPPEKAGRGPLPGSLEIRLRVAAEGFAPRELKHVVRIKGMWPSR